MLFPTGVDVPEMFDDPTYRQRFKQAGRRWLQSLEDEANRRAHDGVESPVLYKGHPVFTEGLPLKKREYSDTILLALLRAYDRERFGDKSQLDVKFPTRWEDLPESIQAEIIENLNARVQALEAEERAKLEAQKQLPAGEQTVDVTGD